MNLETPGYIDGLPRRLEIKTEEYSASKAKSKYQKKMSPSQLAKECTAQIWYKWRNVKLPTISGRLARIFADGNNAEPEMIAILRGIGFTVWDRETPTHVLGYHAESDCYFIDKIDEFYDETRHRDAVDDVSDIPFHVEAAKRQGVEYKPPSQIKIEDMDGHFVGFLDGIGTHPELTFGENVLIEAKTMNTKNFRNWQNKRIAVSHPEYYAQAIIYMKYKELNYCLFIVKNKDDGDICYEMIRRNDSAANEYLRRAAAVITMKVTPEKVSYSAASHKCKFCDFIEICHYAAPVDINCRSCVNCVAAPEGQFYCEKWQSMIPKDAIPKACGNHNPVK